MSLTIVLHAINGRHRSVFACLRATNTGEAAFPSTSEGCKWRQQACGPYRCISRAEASLRRYDRKRGRKTSEDEVNRVAYSWRGDAADLGQPFQNNLSSTYITSITLNGC